MATINKKPTKAHKDKKVIKAHQGMAHVPKPTQGKTRGPIATKPQPLRTQIEPAVVQQPIKRRRPPRISDGPSDGGGRGITGGIRQRPVMDSRARRRRDNAVKSELDEIRRQSSKRKRRRLPIRQPRVAMPYNPAVDDFGIGRPNIGRPNVVQPYKPNPLVDNIVNVLPRFNSSTALTDRFTKPIDRGPMPNARTQRRNKGGDIKKYATGGLNKGMTKSRTKYGTVDNKKK